MQPQSQIQLLALNRRFYATVADPFDATRQATPAGKVELVARLPLQGDGGPVRVIDVGCGNGRLAWLLAARGLPIDYVGVDANRELLTRAQAHTQTLAQVQTHFVQADLADPAWRNALPCSAHGFGVVACLATLHHLPGADLRRRVMGELASLASPTALIALSTWQFLTTPRMAAKTLDWSVVGIDPATVDPGDALLPWQQGGYAVRYVHQIDAAEIAELAAQTGLQVVESFRADGKEGNLNLYTLLRHAPAGTEVDHDAGLSQSAPTQSSPT
jgi:SAM-dependent methyltransferase